MSQIPNMGQVANKEGQYGLIITAMDMALSFAFCFYGPGMPVLPMIFPMVGMESPLVWCFCFMHTSVLQSQKLESFLEAS
jgi:hypothetical protein